MAERRDDRRRGEPQRGRGGGDGREEDEGARPRHRRVLVAGERVVPRVRHEAVGIGAPAEDDVLADHHGVEAGVLGLLRHADEGAEVARRRQRPVLREDVDQPDATHPSLDLRARPVAPRALDVLAHDALGAVAVARLDRGEQLRVLGDVGLLPVGLRAAPREEAPADVGDPERVEEPEERVVPRRRRDREMERAAGVVCDRGRARRPLVVDRSAERGEIRRPYGAPPRGARARARGAGAPRGARERGPGRGRRRRSRGSPRTRRARHRRAGGAPLAPSRARCRAPPRARPVRRVHRGRGDRRRSSRAARRTRVRRRSVRGVGRGSLSRHRAQSRKVDIRCSNLYTIAVPGARGAGQLEEDHG